jgi:hypothetical protein
MNDHVRYVFWGLFVALAGVVLARIVAPVAAQQVLIILSVVET